MYHITCFAASHRGEERLFIDCPHSAALNTTLKLLQGIRWSKTQKRWHVPLTAAVYKQLCKLTLGIATIDDSKVKAVLNPVRVKEQAVMAGGVKQVTVPSKLQCRTRNEVPEYAGGKGIEAINAHVLPAMKRHLVLKAYSGSTIRTYTNELRQLLLTAKNNSIDDFDADRVKNYLQYCFEKLHVSEHTLHSRINSLKFYYEQVLGRKKLFWEIPRPKKPMQLPRFFNQDEVAAIINSTANVKHKTMLMLCYSTGLRVSEVVSLKTRNIDIKRMAILVEQAKGKKDRIVPLSPVLLVMLREYARICKPLIKGFLFAGQFANQPYGVRTLQEILQAAKEKGRVYKQGGVHALRHSFATHLLDKGTDISMIQKLLGHNDLKTTLRYLHTTNKDILNVISPLDSLGLTL